MKVKYHRLQRLCENSEIPPTRVDGLFRSNLQRRASRICESHQRQLVDCSDPSYRGELSESANPTNGSWWIVQILPTEASFQSLRIPPTEVGGLFRSYLSST